MLASDGDEQKRIGALSFDLLTRLVVEDVRNSDECNEAICPCAIRDGAYWVMCKLKGSSSDNGKDGRNAKAARATISTKAADHSTGQDEDWSISK